MVTELGGKARESIVPEAKRGKCFKGEQSTMSYTAETERKLLSRYGKHLMFLVTLMTTDSIKEWVQKSDWSGLKTEKWLRKK